MKKNRVFLISIFLVSLLIMSVKMVNGQEEFTISLNTTLSGPAATGGIQNKNGSEMAVEDINKAGGINGKPLKLLVDDNKLSPSEAVLIAKRRLPNAQATIVGVSGSCFLAVMPIAAELGIPIFGAGIGTVGITERGNKYVFRTHFNDKVGAYVIVDYLVKNLKLTRIAVANEDSDYGMGGATSIKEAFSKLNLKPIAEERFSPGTIDYTAIIARIKEANPEAIVVWAFPAESCQFIKHAREAGIEAVIGGGATLDDDVIPKLAGEACNGVVYISPYFPDPNDPKLQNFINRYGQKYGIMPNVYAVNPYDTVCLIAEVMKKAGKNKEKFLEAIRSIQFRGLNQELTFNGKGDNLRPIYLVNWKDGKRTKIMSVDIKGITRSIEK